jgi:hypothetical protein
VVAVAIVPGVVLPAGLWDDDIRRRNQDKKSGERLVGIALVSITAANE